MKRTSSLIIGLAAACALLAACGSGVNVTSLSSSKTEPPTASSIASPAKTTASPPNSAPTATTGAGETTVPAAKETTPLATTAVPAGGGSQTKFCALSKTFEAKYKTVFDQLQTLSPAERKKLFASLNTDLAAWVAAAPGELKAATAFQLAQAQALEAILVKNDYDLTKAIADPDYATAVGGSGPEPTNAAGQSASDQIDAYTQNVCGIPSDSGSSAPTEEITAAPSDSSTNDTSDGAVATDVTTA
jgi:hypothetical protein